VPVEMCSVKSRKYQWRPLTVDFSDLLKGAKPHQNKSSLASATIQTSGASPAPDAEQSSVGIAPEPARR
jgi:hypothetical protein